MESSGGGEPLPLPLFLSGNAKPKRQQEDSGGLHFSFISLPIKGIQTKMDHGERGIDLSFPPTDED